MDISKGSERVIRGCALATERGLRSRVGRVLDRRVVQVQRQATAESEIQSPILQTFFFLAHMSRPANFIGCFLEALHGSRLRIKISLPQNESVSDLRIPYHCRLFVGSNTPPSPICSPSDRELRLGLEQEKQSNRCFLHLHQLRRPACLLFRKLKKKTCKRRLSPRDVKRVDARGRSKSMVAIRSGTRLQ